VCRRSNRSRQVHTRRKISVDHISQLKRYAAIVSSRCVSIPFSALILYSARIFHQPAEAAKTNFNIQHFGANHQLHSEEIQLDLEQLCTEVKDIRDFLESTSPNCLIECVYVAHAPMRAVSALLRTLVHAGSAVGQSGFSTSGTQTNLYSACGARSAQHPALRIWVRLVKFACCRGLAGFSVLRKCICATASQGKNTTRGIKEWRLSVS